MATGVYSDSRRVSRRFTGVSIARIFLGSCYCFAFRRKVPCYVRLVPAADDLICWHAISLAGRWKVFWSNGYAQGCGLNRFQKGLEQSSRMRSSMRQDKSANRIASNMCRSGVYCKDVNGRSLFRLLLTQTPLISVRQPRSIEGPRVGGGSSSHEVRRSPTAGTNSPLPTGRAPLSSD